MPKQPNQKQKQQKQEAPAMSVNQSSNKQEEKGTTRQP